MSANDSTRQSRRPVAETEVSGVTVFSFPHEPGAMANLDQVRTYFATAFAEHAAPLRRLAIDFSGVSTLDSSCLGPLLQKLRDVHDHGGRLVLCCVESAGLREIFALTRFDKVFPIYPTRAEALASFPPL
jgi:anti-anti-sigma factor